jgi:hypothetical protein
LLIGWSTYRQFTGQVERVRYRGSQSAAGYSDGTQYLITDPHSYWFISPNDASSRALLAGCTYDFRHFTTCAKGCDRNRVVKWVRGIEFVSCP